MATPGVYVYKRNGRVAYVGRSDRDVDARESASFRAANYDLTVTIHERSSAFQAYRTECRPFHKHRPSDTAIYPAVPAGANWRWSTVAVGRSTLLGKPFDLEQTPFEVLDRRITLLNRSLDECSAAFTASRGDTITRRDIEQGLVAVLGLDEIFSCIATSLPKRSCRCSATVILHPCVPKGSAASS
jgi:hypothetical protein